MQLATCVRNKGSRLHLERLTKLSEKAMLSLGKKHINSLCDFKAITFRFLIFIPSDVTDGS